MYRQSPALGVGRTVGVISPQWARSRLRGNRHWSHGIPFLANFRVTGNPSV